MGPKEGYNCNPEWALNQKKAQSLVQQQAKFDPMSMEHCPDFDERMTLTDGKTIGVPYPKEGYNCNPEWALAQKKTTAAPPDGFKGLEHCPDFDERFTLANGRDKAIPYPQTGYNCTKDYALMQLAE